MTTSVSALLPTGSGQFIIHSFENKDSPYNPHIVLVSSGENLGNSPLVRIHSECLTGDVFGSLRCDCGFQLHTAMKMLSEEPGLLIYLRQEGRGIGLHSKISAYQKQDEGYDTVEANIVLGYKADLRNYEMASAILNHFNISTLRLLSNNPAKVEALRHNGFTILATVPLVAPLTDHNRAYLQTKQEKMGHIFPEWL